ncbi:MAG: glycosyl hydrolase family 18 protein [Ignavibacteriaceae bacterium]
MFSNCIKLFVLIIFSSQIILFAQRKEIVAYYPGGGFGNKGYVVKNLKTSGSADKITVLIYAFGAPAPDSSGNIVAKINPYVDYEQPYPSAMSIDGIADDSTQPLRGQFNQLKKLKSEYPNIKILLSFGGWGGGTYFSDAVLTNETREIFVNDCINKFIYGNLPLINGAGGEGAAAGIFDGFDIDWEFPVSGGPEGTHNNIDDKENFTKLLALFREKLNAVNPKLILTAAVAADKPNLNNYDIKKEEKYLNWFNLMTYDFHGSWNNTTAHHTNLLSSSQDTTDNGAEHSFDKSVKYFIDSLGVDSRKIIPGAAFYGKCWFDVDSVNGGLYQPGKDSAGAFSDGFGNYIHLRNAESMGYKYYWDALAMAPWLYDWQKKIFWTFDDTKSIALKARYVDAYNLGGLMFWEISEDDSAGTLVSTIFNKNMPDIKIVKTVSIKSFPSLKITDPQNLGNVIAGSNLIINTSESDKNGSIMKVEYYGDGVSLGYDTKAPFDWVWFNISKGKHYLKAVATDNIGTKAYSNVVKFDVR